MPASAAQPVPSLSRQRVAQEARALVEGHGFDHLTIRGLARRLGVQAPSLYEYVTSKDDLVDLVVAELVEEAAAGWDPPSDWDQLLRYVARWWHRLMSEHPVVHASILRHPTAVPVALETVERVLAALAAAGLDPDAAMGVYTEFFGYVVGATALSQQRALVRAGNGVSESVDRKRIRSLAAGLDSGRFPHLVAAAGPVSRLATEAAFEAGLSALVDTLRYRVAAAGG